MNDQIAIITAEDFPTAMAEGKKLIPFSPSLEQVQDLERDLSTYLKANHPELFKKWTAYYRQYMGIQQVQGVKKIRGNFLCEVDGNRWKEQWIMVKDGGDCYFNFSYEVEEKKIIEFSVNGEA